MTKITKKTKTELQNVINDLENVTITVTIDSNHKNPKFDDLLNSMESIISTMHEYKPKEKEVKPKKEPKKSKKLKVFGGNYV